MTGSGKVTVKKIINYPFRQKLSGIPSKMGKKQNIRFILFLGVCAFILLVNLGGWDMKGTDEPRYAQIAREMMETGRYIVPILTARPIQTSPRFFSGLSRLHQSLLAT